MYFQYSRMRLEFPTPQRRDAWLAGPLGPWIDDEEVEHLFHELLMDGAADRPADDTPVRALLETLGDVNEEPSALDVIAMHEHSGFLRVEVARSAARAGATGLVVLIGREPGHLANCGVRVTDASVQVFAFSDERVGDVAEDLEGCDMAELLDDLEAYADEDW